MHSIGKLTNVAVPVVLVIRLVVQQKFYPALLSKDAVTAFPELQIYKNCFTVVVQLK